jgi:hypothetical protein
MITQEYLKECVTYNPGTGVFVWLNRPLIHFKNIIAHRAFNSMYAGKEAGSDKADGRIVYRQIGIDGFRYLSHRLAWLLVYGELPKQSIDHIDGNGLNNTIDNLRDVSRQENHRNTRLPSNSTSGVIGVHWLKKNQRWLAHITVDKNCISLGCFSTLEEAAAARKISEIEYGFHENHGRSSQEQDND